jgi:G2/mitotic-specific cyclin 3/4
MLFLAINIIDRYLSIHKITINRLQLLGIAAFSIALKYENGKDIRPSTLRHFCDDAFEREDIYRAESFVLRELEYNLGWPGPLPFLERLSRADKDSAIVKELAKYLLEATIANYEFIAKPPSMMAAAAYFLARRILGNCEWVRFIEIL